MAALLVDLEVAKTHSRPHVSDDNPYLRGAVQDAQVPARLPRALRQHRGCPRPLPAFFPWYNDEHRHSGIGFMTPAAVHFGHAAAIDEKRPRVLQAAYAAHPTRFKGRVPTPPALPDVVGINLPKPIPTHGDHP